MHMCNMTRHCNALQHTATHRNTDRFIAIMHGDEERLLPGNMVSACVCACVCVCVCVCVRACVCMCVCLLHLCLCLCMYLNVLIVPSAPLPANTLLHPPPPQITTLEGPPESQEVSVAVCCSVLQCVVVCCSVLQCDAV